MEQTYATLIDRNCKAKRVDVNCTSNIVSDAAYIDWTDALEYLDSSSSSPSLLEVQSDQTPVRLRVLTTDSPNLTNQALRLSEALVPVPAEVLAHVAVSMPDFEALWQNDAGSVTLLDGPRRFLMQTPNDGDLFCSMIVQSSGFLDDSARKISLQRADPLYRAILISSDPMINMPKIAPSFSTPTTWNETNLPIVLLPLEFLLRHVRQVSKTLAQITTEVSDIEETVINGNVLPVHSEQFTSTFTGLIKRLHICNRENVKLRRRWHFQMGLAKTILELIKSHETWHISSFDPSPLIYSLEYRQLRSVASLQIKLSESLEYDLDVLPVRISNQFNAIFNLMAQSDTHASMSIAISSRKDNEYMQSIADATLRDSSSMKTIALLTMVFLPGTFICSFFSMTMFNWNSQPGEPLVSPYIWAYFVAMVPLTLLVIAIWWWKTKESRREQEDLRQRRRLIRGNTVIDLENLRTNRV
ncbi:hypothetical protein HYFRA_00002804 [Hymenoscyphus fraxineus]|uniref:Uncharacterized protein n=1 Tax=Hymenoscyphus fraxineus TaxID=746836 RepID=A0A9N9KR42_9HELO|nr:hypothetical protein HYFRA_00002804 [Hymenoscyphus fraxineus]